MKKSYGTSDLVWGQGSGCMTSTGRKMPHLKISFSERRRGGKSRAGEGAIYVGLVTAAEKLSCLL